MKTKLLLSILALLVFSDSKAQWEDKIYGLNNASSGVFYFSEIDLNTGELNDLNELDMDFYTNNYSSAYSNILEEYYICTGQELIKVDIYTGEVNETVELPIDGNYLHIHYDMCDRVLYGIINNWPNGISFAKFDLTENEFFDVLPIDEYESFCMGCQSVIDYENRIFYYKSGSDGGRLIGIDLETVEVITDPMIFDITNGNFGHIDLWCEDNQIYGTTADVNDSAKQLAVIDKESGNSTLVSDEEWNTGIFKPATGGSCIDQEQGIYYYSGAGSLVVGVDIESGEQIEEFNLGAGEFLFMEHFSDCICQEEEIVSVEEDAPDISFYPNPMEDFLQLDNIPKSIQELNIYNSQGELCLSRLMPSHEQRINTSDLSTGVYFVNFVDDSGKVIHSKTVLKQ